MLTGIRGSHGGSWEAAHELRDGRAWDNPSEVDDPYDLSVNLQRFYSAFDRDLYESLDLTDGVFFDKETFGVDRLVPGYQRLPWAEFAARTPISDLEQKDLVRLHEEGKDYLPGLSSIEKKLGSARLATATI